MSTAQARKVAKLASWTHVSVWALYLFLVLFGLFSISKLMEQIFFSGMILSGALAIMGGFILVIKRKQLAEFAAEKRRAGQVDFGLLNITIGEDSLLSKIAGKFGSDYEISFSYALIAIGILELLFGSYSILLGMEGLL